MISTSKRDVLLEHVTIIRSRLIAAKIVQTHAKTVKRPSSTWHCASGRAHAISQPVSIRDHNAAPGKKWQTLWSMRPTHAAHSTMKRDTRVSATLHQFVHLVKVRMSTKKFKTFR